MKPNYEIAATVAT